MELVQVDQSESIATLTINRPEALNALNQDVLMELRQKILELSDARVLVLTGSGEKAFVAGADIKAMSQMSAAEARAFAELGQGVVQLIEQGPFVSVAAVNGFALGGGLELALSCDLIYSADNARFAAPETNLGIIPGFGGTVNIVARAGMHAAMEMILTGDMMSAERAHQLGLVAKVFPQADLMGEVQKIASKLSLKGIYSMLAAKRLVRASSGSEHERALLLERESFANLFAMGEPQEGMAAFLEKRSPDFYK